MSEEHKYFDQFLGEQDAVTDHDDVVMLKRIIEAHSKGYSDEETMNFKRIGLHLRMKRYFSEPISTIKPVGEFLDELLSIYKVKKTKFAELIDYESSNLHAVLKGRRRLNNKLAMKIGLIFSIDPQLWMYIDAKNELAKYQLEHKLSSRIYSLEKLKQAR